MKRRKKYNRRYVLRNWCSCLGHITFFIYLKVVKRRFCHCGDSIFFHSVQRTNFNNKKKNQLLECTADTKVVAVFANLPVDGLAHAIDSIVRQMKKSNCRKLLVNGITVAGMSVNTALEPQLFCVMWLEWSAVLTFELLKSIHNYRTGRPLAGCAVRPDFSLKSGFQIEIYMQHFFHFWDLKFIDAQEGEKSFLMWRFISKPLQDWCCMYSNNTTKQDPPSPPPPRLQVELASMYDWYQRPVNTDQLLEIIQYDLYITVI